jgi:hypothetical protein
MDKKYKILAHSYHPPKGSSIYVIEPIRYSKEDTQKMHIVSTYQTIMFFPLKNDYIITIIYM